MMQWQPIETAPQGQRVLLFVLPWWEDDLSNGKAIPAIHGRDGAWRIDNGDEIDSSDCKLISWQPLPAPPVQPFPPPLTPNAMPTPTHSQLTAFETKWKPILQSALPPPAPWMDEKDIATEFKMTLEQIGGWLVVYRAVQQGVQNGYTEEKQQKIVKALLRRG